MECPSKEILQDALCMFIAVQQSRFTLTEIIVDPCDCHHL